MHRGVGGAVVGAGAAVAAVVAFVFLLIVTLFVQDDSDRAETQASADTCVVFAKEGGAPNEVPEKWRGLIEEASTEAGVPFEVLAAQLGAESGWDPEAVSPRGAIGLAQFMPDTWLQYGVGDPTDPKASIQAQGRYMKALMDEAAEHSDGPEDQIEKALAAYNWGPGNMDGAGWDWRANGPAETRGYVSKILDGSQGFSVDCSAAAGVDNLGDLGDGEWAPPLPGGTLGSGYGPRNLGGFAPAWANNHVGLDISTDKTLTSHAPGGSVVAVADMVITRATCGGDASMGCHVTGRLLGGDGVMVGYYHLAEGSLEVERDDQVRRGAKLGVEGNTGSWAFPTHLHFEMYRADAPDDVYPLAGFNVDPTPVLKEKGAL